MKTQHIFTLTILLFLTANLVVGQQRKNLAEINEFARIHSEMALKKKAEAEQEALQKGWIIYKEFDDGKVMEIMELGPNGMPEYNVTMNENAAETTGTDELLPGGGSGLNLDGDGYTLGEWDGGGVRTTHQEFRVGAGASRVTQKDAPGSLSSHSTHVAGTLIAEGEVAGAMGMAPEAELHAYDWTNDLSEMATANSTDGIRLSNHSYDRTRGWSWDNVWGWYWFGDTTISTTEDYLFGFYSTLSSSWDSLLKLNDDYLPVFAAGNDRDDDHAGTHWVWDETLGNWVQSTAARDEDGGADGYDCISNRGISKNVLTVGACEDIPGGWSAASDVVLTDFSSYGPSDDGRIKPEIVANGDDLYSTDDDSNSDYTWKSGTSMATPNICGTLALLQDYYGTLNSGDFMYAHELKALVINTANEAGPNAGPDYMHGWGLFNAVGAADLITLDDTEGYHIQESYLTNGETEDYIYYCDGTQDVNVTIAWVDPAHAGLTPSLNPNTITLVNDLDLLVTNLVSSTNYQPWMLHPNTPAGAAYKGRNYRDNMEQVNITSPASGNYRIRIDHTNTITGNWYALVVSAGMKRVTNLTWNGSSSTSWNSTSNWTPNTIPDGSHAVTIPSGCPNYPVLSSTLRIANGGSSTYKCNSLNIQSGGKLSIVGSGSLYCYGELTIADSLKIGNDFLVNEGGDVTQTGGNVLTGTITGYYGDLTVNSGGSYTQSGGNLYVEQLYLTSGCQFTGSGGITHMYANGDAPATQVIDIDDINSYFYNFYIDAGSNVEMTSCTYDLDVRNNFNNYDAFSLNGHLINTKFMNVYGDLAISSGTLDVLTNGPYFSGGGNLIMSGGELRGNLNIKFNSGSSENVTGGTIVLQQNFYNTYGIFTPTGGIFKFIGSDTSDIIGATQFYDLQIDKSTGVFNAVENGTHNNGVFITVLNELHIYDGSFELNYVPGRTATLSVGRDIVIEPDGVLNANDSPGVTIECGDDWNNQNPSGFSTSAGTAVTFNGSGVGGGNQYVREAITFPTLMVNNSAGDYVRPWDASSPGNVIKCTNAEVTAGGLNPASFRIQVSGNLDIYGQLIMTSAADTLSVNGNLTWKNGSTDNVTEGYILIGDYWTFENGTSAQLGSNNTVKTDQTGSTMIRCDDEDASFGKVDIGKDFPSTYTTYIHAGSIYDMHVSGDFYVRDNNNFNIQDRDMFVGGSIWDEDGSSISMLTGGDLEVDGDYFTNGVFTVGSGSALIHGQYHIYATGNTSIGSGSLISDEPGSGNWRVIAGTFSLTSGLFENTNNAMLFQATSVNTISGGTIRCGGSFSAITPDNFQPSGGVVELLPVGYAPWVGVDADNNNWVNNLIINSSGTSFLLNYDLKVRNDITFNSGILNGSNDTIWVAGDWNNNVGASAFASGTGDVIFNGTGAFAQQINGTTTFHNVTNENATSHLDFTGSTTITNNFLASAAGASSDQFITGSMLDVQDILDLSLGTLTLSASTPTVTVSTIMEGGTLNVINGSFTADDIDGHGLNGEYILQNGTITLTQSAGQYVDLNNSITINNGTFNVFGGTGGSWWPNSASASLTMTGGVLNIRDNSISIQSTSLIENISGGIIKTGVGFDMQGSATSFNPTGGTIEIYGPGTGTLDMTAGSNFYNIDINKDPGIAVNVVNNLIIKSTLTITSGILNTNSNTYNIHIGP